MFKRFNVYDNRDGSVIALSEYAVTAEEAIKQVAKRCCQDVKNLRAECLSNLDKMF